MAVLNMLSALSKRILLVFFGNGFGKAILTAFEFSLAAGLGATQFGRFSICLALLMVSSSLSLLGMNFGIVQYLAIYQEQQRNDKIQNLIRSSLVVVGLAGLLAGLIIIAGSHLLAFKLFKKPELLVALVITGIAIPIEALNQCLAAIFRGLRRFKTYVFVSDIVKSGCLILSIPFIFLFHLEFEGIICILLVIYVLALITGLFILSREFHFLTISGLINWPIIKEVLEFSYWLFIWNIFQQLASRFQILLAGVFLTNQQVGVLGVLMRLLLVFTFMRSAVNQVTAVEFARLNYLEDKENLKNLFKSISLILLIVSTILAIPIAIRPGVVLGIFGKEYRVYGWQLLLLISVQIANVSSGPSGQLLVNCRKQWSVLFAALFASFVQFSLSFWLMPSYGVTGGVLAQSITILAFAVTRQLFSFGLLRIHCFSSKFFVFAFIGTISILSGFYAAKSTQSLLGFGLGVIAAVVCYFILLGGYFLIDEPFRKQIVLSLARLRRA